MKYFFYVIYMFYKKVIKIEQWGDTPFFYTNMVLALFQTFILDIIKDFYLLYSMKGEMILTVKYYSLIFFITGMLLYFANRAYFLNKEKKILKEMNNKSFLEKVIINILIVVVLIFIFYHFIHTSILIRENNDRFL